MYNPHNSQITSLDTYFLDKRNTAHLLDFHVTETLIAHRSTHKLLYQKKEPMKGVRQNNTVEEETRKRRHAYELETQDVDQITSNAWRNANATNDICKKFRQKSGAIQHVQLQVVR